MNSLDARARISGGSFSSHRGTGGELPSSPAQPSLAAGDVLAGKYEILGLLGAGGMGTVWRARCRVLDIDVAIKVLRGDRDGVAVERLRREAQATARLGHPAIVRVFDFGQTDAGEPFLVTTDAMGTSLEHCWLGRASSDFGPAIRSTGAHLGESGVRPSALAISLLSERAPSGSTTQAPPGNVARRGSRRRVRGALFALVAAPVVLGLVGLCTHGFSIAAPAAPAAATRVAPAEVWPAALPAGVTTSSTVLESSGITLDGAAMRAGTSREARPLPAGPRRLSSAVVPLPRSPDF